jgi:hypothetical protein
MTLRYRATLLKRRFQRGYYRRVHGVAIPPSMLPETGDGKFVSVHMRGEITEIIDHRSGGMIRLIPYKSNHGVMVERWLDDVMRWRTHCDYDQFVKMGFESQEIAA